MIKDGKSLSWLAYERAAAVFTVDQETAVNITVLPNVVLVGRISGSKRQIDVLIDSRWDDGNNRRIIVDAKYRSRKINVRDIEAFEGMMKDCGAARGVIVSNKGFTTAAMKRAQDAIIVTILTTKELDDFPWEYEPCYGSCNSLSVEKRGMVLWSSTLHYASDLSQPALVMQTGKCDGCHCFHVHCWQCGGKFSIADESAHKCICGHIWIAPYIKSDSSVVLGKVVDQDYYLVLDRRPIS